MALRVVDPEGLVWYHGTGHEFEVGDHVTPRGEQRNHPEKHDGSRVHITPSPVRAWQYASLARQSLGDSARTGGPLGEIIYEVKPLGEVFQNLEYEGEYVADAAVVVRRVDLRTEPRGQSAPVTEEVALSSD